MGDKVIDKINAMQKRMSTGRTFAKRRTYFPATPKPQPDARAEDTSPAAPAEEAGGAKRAKGR